jgi:hypothetical protein
VIEIATAIRFEDLLAAMIDRSPYVEIDTVAMRRDRYQFLHPAVAQASISRGINLETCTFRISTCERSR